MDKNIFTKGIGRCKFNPKIVPKEGGPETIDGTCGKSFYNGDILFCALDDSIPVEKLSKCPKKKRSKGPKYDNRPEQIDAFEGFKPSETSCKPSGSNN